MSAPLTTRNVEVKTATVEIKTLTVSGKQVTLAVFRQLIDEPAYTDTYIWRGIPWGTVNYCPGDKHCQTAGWWASSDVRYAHRYHIVWQKGNELRRSAFPDYLPYSSRPSDMSQEDWKNLNSLCTMRHAQRLLEIKALPQLFIAV